MMGLLNALVQAMCSGSSFLFFTYSIRMEISKLKCQCGDVATRSRYFNIFFLFNGLWDDGYYYLGGVTTLEKLKGSTTFIRRT